MDKPSTWLKVIVWWGRIYRVLFITAVGVVAYLWFDPKSLMDTPFSNLTFRMIANNLLGVLIPLACIFWMFDFPDVLEDRDSENSPYIFWSNFSLLVPVVVVVACYFLYGHA